ncbi:hypothetical protein E4K10_14725 [Streptomyces sp. T1317-0309]|nr:hypothetical protein E4K10_14725 [Streptomyces sp. T1317-0309]
MASAFDLAGRASDPPAHATKGPQSRTAPLPSLCRPPAARGIASTAKPRYAVLDSWPLALSARGRASAQRGRSGPKAGA